MSESEQQGSRLDQVRNTLGISQVKFSKRIGISQGYLNQVLKGRRNISYKILNSITTAFPKINTEWILRGEGVPFKSEAIPDKLEETAFQYGKPVKQIALQDLAEIILSIQAENTELRRRIEALEHQVNGTEPRKSKRLK